MVKFIGVKQTKPLALCQQGAHPMAHVLMTKTRKVAAPTAPQPEIVPENTDMDMKALKAIALMNDTTKAYFVALDDEKAAAFLAKSADDQAAEAKAADDAAKKLAADAAAVAAGKTAREVELETTVSTLQTTVKALQDQGDVRDIEKRAETEFAGYPGGKAEVVKALTACKGLTADQRTIVEDGLKATIKAAKLTTRTLGFQGLEAAAMPASKKIDDAAKKLASEKSISYPEAYYQLSESPEWQKDFVEASTEMQEVREPA